MVDELTGLEDATELDEAVVPDAVVPDAVVPDAVVPDAVAPDAVAVGGAPVVLVEFVDPPVVGEPVAPSEWPCEGLRLRSCADAVPATAMLSTSSGLTTQTASVRGDGDRADSARADSEGGDRRGMWNI